MLWQADAAIPFLDQALDPALAQPILSHHLGQLGLDSARLIRHKPGHRALVEYKAASAAGPLVMIGKIRARGLDTRTYRTMCAARDAGIPVPEPLALVPEFQMVVQRKVAGIPLTALLSGPNGTRLARGAAALVRQLHEAAIHPERIHTLADELRILREVIPRVAEHHSQWAGRLSTVLERAHRLAWTLLPAAGRSGIHRDFYADQVLVDGEKLILLDFDLYCAGDPALDIGNFAAHVIEQALREHGNPDALAGREQAFVEHYLSLAGSEGRRAVDVYTTLTLVRHLWISTRIPERRQITGRLIDLCELRLARQLSNVADQRQ